jgi:hypothetical protein
MKFGQSLLGMLMIGAVTTPLIAQETEPPRQFGPWVRGVEGGAVHQFRTDLDDAPGSFSVDRYFLQPSLGYAWDRRTSVSVSLGIGESDYNFSEEASVAGGRPWKRIRDYRVSVPIRFSPHEKADVIVIPSLRTYAESGASLDDGRTEGVLAGFGWRFSDKLTLGPGFGYFSELGGGSQAFPIVVVNWKITERLSMETGRGLAASQGPGVSLNYALSDRWKLGFTARYEQIRFALNEDGPAAGGYGEDRSAPMLLTAEYSPWPMTSVSALIGVETAGSLRLEDSNTELIERADYKPAPLIGVVFSTRF